MTAAPNDVNDCLTQRNCAVVAQFFVREPLLEDSVELNLFAKIFNFSSQGNVNSTWVEVELSPDETRLDTYIKLRCSNVDDDTYVNGLSDVGDFDSTIVGGGMTTSGYLWCAFRLIPIPVEMARKPSSFDPRNLHFVRIKHGHFGPAGGTVDVLDQMKESSPTTYQFVAGKGTWIPGQPIPKPDDNGSDVPDNGNDNDSGPAPAPDASASTKASSNKTLFIIIGVVVVLLLIAGAAFFVTRKGPKQEKMLGRIDKNAPMSRSVLSSSPSSIVPERSVFRDSSSQAPRSELSIAQSTAN